MAQRDISETIRRTLDETAARERQRPNESIAEEIMQHRRAAARRVKADLLFRLEHGDFAVLRKRSCRRKAGDAAADDEDVRIAHAAVSRSLTTLPPCVRRKALTIS